jgi:hypothetical protein
MKLARTDLRRKVWMAPSDAQYDREAVWLAVFQDGSRAESKGIFLEKLEPSCATYAIRRICPRWLGQKHGRQRLKAFGAEAKGADRYRSDRVVASFGFVRAAGARKQFT